MGNELNQKLLNLTTEAQSARRTHRGLDYLAQVALSCRINSEKGLPGQFWATVTHARPHSRRPRPHPQAPAREWAGASSVYLGGGRKVRRKEAQERAKLCEARGGRSAAGLGSLEMARGIRAEVFHAQSGEVEEMMQSRLVDRRWQRWPGSTPVYKI